MPLILYFRGEGKVAMAGVKEYIVLIDADEISDEETAHRTAPGFELHSTIEIDEDISELPCDETLIPL